MILTEKQKIKIIIGSALYVVIGVTINNYKIHKQYSTKQSHNTKIISVKNTSIDKLISLNKDYLYKLGKLESDNNWKSIGGYHDKYIGKYQFGRSALKDIKLYPKVSLYKFKKNRYVFDSQLQDRACIMLMKHNDKYMRDYYNYIGQRINGVLITRAGILASAHLVGHKSLKKWLETKGRYTAKDGFGTTVEKYMKAMERVKIII